MSKAMTFSFVSALLLFACASPSGEPAGSTNDALMEKVGVSCTTVMAATCITPDGHLIGECSWNQEERFEVVTGAGKITGIRYSTNGGSDRYREPLVNDLLLDRLADRAPPADLVVTNGWYPEELQFRGLDVSTGTFYSVDVSSEDALRGLHGRIRVQVLTQQNEPLLNEHTYDAANRLASCHALK